MPSNLVRSYHLIPLLLVVCICPRLVHGQAPDPQLARQLDPLVERAGQLNLSPGFSVAVVRGDAIVYLKSYGVADIDSGRPVSPDTPFYIASSTKALTALAFVCLATEGAIDLDDPLSRLLPALKLKPPLSADSISLCSLLAMTSGIAGGPVDFRMSYTGEGSRAELLKILESHDALKTGNAFSYNNLPYQVLGLGLEEKLGRSWKDIVQQKVLEPLQMTSTRAHRTTADMSVLALPHSPTPTRFRRIHFAKEDSNLHAAGGHVSSAVDLARFLVAELNDGTVAGRQVIPADAIRQTQRPHATQDRMAGEIHRHAWGLGWDIGTLHGQTILQRPGGFPGYQSDISFMPDRKIGVVILANGGGIGGALVELLSSGIYEQLLELPDAQSRFDAKLKQRSEQLPQVRQRIADELARRGSRPQTLSHAVQAYAGTYANPLLGHMVWTVENNNLSMRMGAAVAEVEVFDGDADKLRVDFTGTGNVAEFHFAAPDAPAHSVTLMGQQFSRK